MCLSARGLALGGFADGNGRMISRLVLVDD